MENVYHSGIYIQKLKQETELRSFYSTFADLKQFLLHDAFRNQEQNISVTFLCFYKNYIISYITLLTDRITVQQDLRAFFTQKDINYKTLPALKIGRMCVDDRFQKQGIGTLMLEVAVQKAKNINEHTAGCRFLTVDAKNESQEFYRKFGFKPIRINQETTAMYLDIKLSQQN